MAVQPLQRNDPLLFFRLDPGEPGILHSGRASESTLLVSAQERANLRRLEAEAMREGRVVVSARIQFSRAFAGSGPTVVAGKTTVVSVSASPPGIDTVPVGGPAVLAPLSGPPGPSPEPVPVATDGGDLRLEAERNADERELQRKELGLDPPPQTDLEAEKEDREEAALRQRVAQLDQEMRRRQFLRSAAQRLPVPRGLDVVG